MAASRLFISLALASMLLVAGCGGSGSSPTAPTVFVPSLAGLWNGTSTFESVTNGECIGDDLRSSLIGQKSAVSFAITQNGSELTVTESYPGSANSCFYAGATTGESLSLSLTSCSFTTLAATTGKTCKNGSRRIQVPVASLITGTITFVGKTATTLTVREVSQWRIATYPGDANVSVMTQTEQLVLTR